MSRFPEPAAPIKAPNRHRAGGALNFSARPAIVLRTFPRPSSEKTHATVY